MSYERTNGSFTALDELVDLVPAIVCSNSSMAIFFYLSNQDLEAGNYLQGTLGRVDMRAPQRFNFPNGNEVLIPNISIESRGTVSICPSENVVYCGNEGIEKFFEIFPDFEIYRPYVKEFTNQKVESERIKLSA